MNKNKAIGMVLQIDISTARPSTVNQFPGSTRHPERSIAIGVINRNAKSRDLLSTLHARTAHYSVYFIASKSRVIYIGMTNDLASARLSSTGTDLSRRLSPVSTAVSPGLLRIVR